MIIIKNVHRQLVVGIQNYAEKHGFTQAILGLSGGIDSSVTAALAVEAFGAENVIGVSMPSKYSSDGSKTDAKELATNFGINMQVIPINTIFDKYLEILNPFFKNRAENCAEENIQARIRANFLFALSNKFNYLVLTTGNKSESMVGYGTLYGDLAGGLAVIGDLYKGTVYELAKHINSNKDIIPKNVFTKAPSAELRPDQKDSDALPEYPKLDAILKANIEKGLTPDEIVSEGHDRDTVTKVMGLMRTSQFKRDQAPPVIKIKW